MNCKPLVTGSIIQFAKFLLFLSWKRWFFKLLCFILLLWTNKLLFYEMWILWLINVVTTSTTFKVVYKSVNVFFLMGCRKTLLFFLFSIFGKAPRFISEISSMYYHLSLHIGSAACLHMQNIFSRAHFDAWSTQEAAV